GPSGPDQPRAAARPAAGRGADGTGRAGVEYRAGDAVHHPAPLRAGGPAVRGRGLPEPNGLRQHPAGVVQPDPDPAARRPQDPDRALARLLVPLPCAAGAVRCPDPAGADHDRADRPTDPGIDVRTGLRPPRVGDRRPCAVLAMRRMGLGGGPLPAGAAARPVQRVVQFFAYIRPRRGAVDRELRRLVTPEQWALLARLSRADRAHLLGVYRRLVAQGCQDCDVLLAALLHDVGKADERARTGVSQRVAAVLLGRF